MSGAAPPGGAGEGLAEAASDAEGGAPAGKRARILDAAERIFAEKGFYTAKVADIARVAGVADGTIYLYFKSKDDLLISIFEDRMEQVNGNLRAALADAESDGAEPLEKLRRLMLGHLARVQRHPLLAEVLTVELRQSSKFLKEYKPSKFGELLKLIARPIEEGQKAGSVRTDIDAHVAARALFGALDELVLAWVLRPRHARGRAHHDLSAMGGQLALLFIDGLRHPAGARSPSVEAPPEQGRRNAAKPTKGAGKASTKRRSS